MLVNQEGPSNALSIETATPTVDGPPNLCHIGEYGVQSYESDENALQVP